MTTRASSSHVPAVPDAGPKSSGTIPPPPPPLPSRDAMPADSSQMPDAGAAEATENWGRGYWNWSSDSWHDWGARDWSSTQSPVTRDNHWGARDWSSTQSPVTRDNRVNPYQSQNWGLGQDGVWRFDEGAHATAVNDEPADSNHSGSNSTQEPPTGPVTFAETDDVMLLSCTQSNDSAVVSHVSSLMDVH